MVVKLDPSSVWSRIATGLMTGSFVGFINALVNYYHQRQQYFEELFKILQDAVHALHLDFNMQRLRLEDLNEMSREKIIAEAVKEAKHSLKKADEMDMKYKTLLSHVDTEAFIPLIPDTTMSAALDRLLNLKVIYVPFLRGEYLTSHSFSMLDPSRDQEEQAITIGDPDDFFDFVMNSNENYFNQLAWCINEISEVTLLLKHGMNGCSSEAGIFLADYIVDYASLALEGVEIKPFIPPVTNDEDENSEELAS